MKTREMADCILRVFFAILVTGLLCAQTHEPGTPAALTSCESSGTCQEGSNE